MKITDAEALTDRVSYCAASQGFIEEDEARREMRELVLSPTCLYARFTSAMVFFAAAAAAAAESIADVRASTVR